MGVLDGRRQLGAAVAAVVAQFNFEFTAGRPRLAASLSVGQIWHRNLAIARLSPGGLNETG
jgi:hypothetical protein